MRKFLSVAAGTLAIGLLVSGGSALAATKGTDRPFNGTYSGTTVVSGGPSTFHSASSGSLNANQLGNGTYRLDTDQAWGDDTNDVCTGSPVVAAVNGTAVLTAAKK